MGSQGDQRAGVGRDPQRGFTLLETFLPEVSGAGQGGTEELVTFFTLVALKDQVRLEPHHTSITCRGLCPRMLQEPKDRVSLKRGKAEWLSGIPCARGAGGACE